MSALRAGLPAERNVFFLPSGHFRARLQVVTSLRDCNRSALSFVNRLRLIVQWLRTNDRLRSAFSFWPWPKTAPRLFKCTRSAADGSVNREKGRRGGK
jgi:hypothetical protein